MRGIAGIVAALALAAPAQAKVTCSSGDTMLVSGGLRLFDTVYADGDDGFGANLFACLPGFRSPRRVGQSYVSVVSGRADSVSWAFDGQRYLATASYEKADGDKSAGFTLFDLATGESRVAFGAFPAGPVRVASDGSMVVIDEGEVEVARRCSCRLVTLSTTGAKATELALTGGTVYWTEGQDVHTAALAGVPDGSEDVLFAPSRWGPRNGACRALRGRTVAAAGELRVVDQGASRLVCRRGVKATLALADDKQAQYTTAANRWLLERRASSLRLVDTRTMRFTSVASIARTTTLLPSGVLAWIDDQGQVLTVRPGQDAKVLVPAADGPTKLASARHTLYWTAGGAPHRAPF